MIHTMPCGCSTKPLNNFQRTKQHLRNGNIVFFDDVRCVEHENGTGLHGFMILKDNTVHSQVFPHDDEPLEGNFDLDKAFDQLSVFNKEGFEFSYGKAELNLGKDGLTLVCGGGF